MNWIEQNYSEEYICGIDEVGRGCLFGDVVVAAVIMKRYSYIEGIRDSKKLTEKKRNILFDEIIKNAVAVGLGSATAKEIDEINILNATKLAMKRSIYELELFKKPDIILIDSVKLDIPDKHISFNHADDLSYNVACASIVAKVSRDRLCYGWEKIYPGYDIAKHKGYGTKAHREAIIKFGSTNLHRKSFKVRV